MQILRRRDVERKTGQARSTIYDGMAAGTFPRPIRLSAKAVGWLESEVEAWIADRIAERDGPARAARPKLVGADR